MNSPEPTANASLAERYRALLGLGGTFLGSSNSWDLYQTIYVETAKVVELYGFLLSLYDDQCDVATVVFSADEGKEGKSGLTYRGSDSEVLRTGTPTAIGDQTDTGEGLVPGDAGPGGPRSTLAVPLRWRNRVTGALAVYASRADAYEAADSELLGRVADLAAVALENMRHVEALQRRSLEAEKLEEIGLFLASSLDFEEVLERVSHAAMDLFDLDGDARGAQGYMERIHEGVKGHRMLASHGVTVSSGIAEFRAGQTVGVDELIQAADRTMYENKAAKR